MRFCVIPTFVRLYGGVQSLVVLDAHIVHSVAVPGVGVVVQVALQVEKVSH